MSLAFKKKSKITAMNAADKLPNWGIFLNAFAPVYFLSFSLLRCYLETELMAGKSFFSYYVALHHTLWNATTILIIILMMNLILKVPIMRLLWVMYGITVMAIPLFYATVTGEHLRLEYLKGSFSEIISYIATFCWTYSKNRPLTIELLVIFFSMFAVGFAYTKKFSRALALAISVHIAGNILAIHWVGPIPYAKSAILFKTQWSHHQFMSVFWLNTLTAMAMLIIWRAGWFGEMQKSWFYAALSAVAVWGVQAIIFNVTGFFKRPFDILLSGLPAITLTFLLVRFFSSERGMTSGWAWAAMSIVFLMQLAVMGPIYFHSITPNLSLL
jgi:hypothetical protein